MATSIFRAITAPAVLSGVGHALIVSTYSKAGSAIMAILTLVSLRNEYHSVRNAKSADYKDSQAAGVWALLQRKFSSPGLCAEMQGWTYLGTTCVCLIHAQYLAALSFTFFSIGAWAGSALANRGRLATNYSSTTIERLAKRCWLSFPAPLQLVLRDPGLTFAIGNIPIFSQSLTTSFKTTQQDSIMLVGILLGAIFALAAVTAGLRPLFVFRTAKATGKASLLSAASNIILGLCILLSALASGEVVGFYTGSAALFWGFGNIGYARRIEHISSLETTAQS